jgi:hypothetical protein
VHRAADPDLERLRRLNDAFRPAAPVDRRALLAGRDDALSELFDTIYEPGQHAFVFGERGVGKTSIVAVLAEMLAAADIVIARVICDHTDDYTSLWHKAIDESVRQQLRHLGLTGAVSEALMTLDRFTALERVTVGDVTTAARAVVAAAPLVVVIDEYDRITGTDARALVAETLKALSDLVLPVTVVLVAVADDVRDVVSAHPSVERLLAQIHVVRMSHDDITAAVRAGFEQTDLLIHRDAAAAITGLSGRVPSYAHLLARHAGRVAVHDDRAEVVVRDVLRAAGEIIDRSPESLVATYDAATASANGTAGAATALLACALSSTDPGGWFTAAAVRGAFKRYELDGAVRLVDDHLDEFTSPRRGRVLVAPSTANELFRFANPLLPPYVLIRGLVAGALTPSVAIGAGSPRR